MKDDLDRLRGEIEEAMAAYSPLYPDVRHTTYLTMMNRIAEYIKLLKCLQLGQTGPQIPEERMQAVNGLTDYPVFICGSARSGTSLLRSLLDNHPQIVVFHPEGTLLHFLKNHANLPEEETVDLILSRNLEQVIANNLGRGPNWLLGGNQSNHQPYLDFIAFFYSYLRDQTVTHEALIRAITRAYMLAGPLSTEELAQKKLWVEKTPTHIYYIDELSKMLPNSRFVFAIRDPRGIFASAKGRYLKKYGDFSGHYHVEGIRTRWKLMLETLDRYGLERCCTVRYEDVVLKPEITMSRLADFLKIEYRNSLLKPTVFGENAVANTGFSKPRQGEAGVSKTSVNRWESILSRAEKSLVSSYVHPYAEHFGYDRGRTSFFSYLCAAFIMAIKYSSNHLQFSFRRSISDWFRQR